MSNIERIGISRVQAIVNEKLKWIFRELNVEDYGVDAHIEIMGEMYATGKLIGVQIKCGDSYFKESNNEKVTFRFDEKHFLYWTNYSLPVIIILVKPDPPEMIWEIINDCNIIKVNDKTYKIDVNRNNTFDENAVNRLLEITKEKLNPFDDELNDNIQRTEDYFDLGYKYEHGENNYVINYAKARYYYKLAADNNNDKIAQFNYSLLLLHGKGGNVDYPQSYIYMQKSALQGFVPAEYNLGLLFFHGKILYKRNIKEAKKWLTIASECGHENARIWLMYCSLYEIIQEIKTPDIKVDTIPFINSFNGLINKISVSDMRSVIKNDIKQSNIIGWNKGLFYIASQAEINARKHCNQEDSEFWKDFQKIILLFDLVSKYYNYNFDNFIINITDYQLELVWKQQLKYDDDTERKKSIISIACNEISHQSRYSTFWKHVKKCSNLLEEIENQFPLQTTSNENISIEIHERTCVKTRVTIKNVSYYLNENNDISVHGNVEAMEDYRNSGELIIMADLCDKEGHTLYTLKNYGGIRFYPTGFYSFYLNCCSINRFFDLKKFHMIRIYPMIKF